MIKVREYLAQLTEACEQYEHSAPTVAAHCDDLFRRIEAGGTKVTLAEIRGVAVLWAGNCWMQPNYAANAIYHLRHRLGMDVTGQTGF